MACFSREARQSEGDEYYLDKYPGSIKNKTWVWHVNHQQRRAMGIDIVPSPLDERIPEAEIIILAIKQVDQHPKDVWPLKLFSGMQQEVLGLLSARGFRLSDLVMDSMWKQPGWVFETIVELTPRRREMYLSEGYQADSNQVRCY